MLFRKEFTGRLIAGLILITGSQVPTLAAPAYAQAAPTTTSTGSTGSGRAQGDYSAYDYQRWAASNCVAERRANTTAGAVIGGLLGAAAGVGLSGRHDHTAGAILGGATGAVAGGAVGGASIPTDCPSGYVERPVTQVYYAPPPPVYYPPVAYGVVYAPGFYRPWVWTGGAWVYRPYAPYHYGYRPYRRW